MTRIRMRGDGYYRAHGCRNVRTKVLRDFRSVFGFASGTSFYQQNSPDASLSLGFSASAMHYLSRLPATLTDHVHVSTARGTERDAFAAQTASDWETILLHRARELVPGDQLVFANFCIERRAAIRERQVDATCLRRWHGYGAPCTRTARSHSTSFAKRAGAGLRSLAEPVLDTTGDFAELVLGVETIAVVADRGYFKIEDIEACETAGMVPYVARPQWGPSVRAGLFRKDDTSRPDR